MKTINILLVGMAFILCAPINAQNTIKTKVETVLPPWGEAKPPFHEIHYIDISNIKNSFLDIPYSNLSNAQKLDVYLPDEKNSTPYPVIVAVHGGGFQEGDKRDRQITPQLNGLKKGYAIVSVNYRLSGEAIFPANINDIKASIRWIRANAGKYHFNPDKIAIWGNSAGANLSSLAGTSGDVKELEDLSLGNAGYSSRLQAVVDWYGPTNFATMDSLLVESGNGKPWHSAPNSSESVVLGGILSKIPERVKAANPETYISPDDPPFLIEHGTIDGTVPTQQAKMFYEKLAKVLGSDKVTLKLIDGARHGGPQFEEPENIDLVFRFLDKYLK